MSDLFSVNQGWKPKGNLREDEDQDQADNLYHHELHHAEIDVFQIPFPETTRPAIRAFRCFREFL